MTSLTIHGIDDGLAKEIKKKSRQLNLSLNKTIKTLLSELLHVGAGKQADHRTDFTEFCGVWSAKEAREFREKIKRSERIDPEDWA